MEDIKKLLSDLYSKTPELRNSATMALWDCWYFEAGEIAETYIRKGEDLMGLNKFEEAQSHFKKVIKMLFMNTTKSHNLLLSLGQIWRNF